MKFLKNLLLHAQIETKLAQAFVPIIQTRAGISKFQARRTFRRVVKKAKELSKEAGTNNLPQNYGDVLLMQESKDPQLKKKLKHIRREGVRDEDIKTWWNLNDLERRISSLMDDFFKIQMVSMYKLEGLSEEEASMKLFKTQPLYGDVTQSFKGSQEDKPLPFELKNRVSKYIVDKSESNAQVLRDEVSNFSSFNAFARSKIKSGDL